MCLHGLGDHSSQIGWTHTWYNGTSRTGLRQRGVHPQRIHPHFQTRFGSDVWSSNEAISGQSQFPTNYHIALVRNVSHDLCEVKLMLFSTRLNKDNCRFPDQLTAVSVTVREILTLSLLLQNITDCWLLLKTLLDVPNLPKKAYESRYSNLLEICLIRHNIWQYICNTCNIALIHTIQL